MCLKKVSIYFEDSKIKIWISFYITIWWKLHNMMKLQLDQTLQNDLKQRFVKLRLLIPRYYIFLGKIFKDFIKNEMNEISLNSTLHDFSADYSLIDKKVYLNL